MTQAQKIAKDKFKKAIEYRKKTGASLKEAFAHIYGKKVGAVKKKAAPKKKSAPKKVAGSHKDTKSHNVNIRVVSGYKKVGALPIDFKGNFLGYRFKVLNQYQIDGGVTAQLVELDGRGDIIAQLTGNPKENDRATAVLYSGGLATGKDVRLDEKDKKDLQKRIKNFVTGLNKEVAAYNSGKDTSKKKSKGLKIVYKPETKKLAVVDQIKSILKSNKKILKGGYTLKTGVIREKKVAGIKVISGDAIGKWGQAEKYSYKLAIELEGKFKNFLILFKNRLKMAKTDAEKKFYRSKIEDAKKMIKEFQYQQKALLSIK